MLDNLVIYKTATPDLPGEFAGGIIEINTKATPDKNFETLSMGSGFNTITTGKNNFIVLLEKQVDWYRRRYKGLPSSFPSVSNFQALQGIRSQASTLAIADIAKIPLQTGPCMKRHLAQIIVFNIL